MSLQGSIIGSCVVPALIGAGMNLLVLNEHYHTLDRWLHPSLYAEQQREKAQREVEFAEGHRLFCQTYREWQTQHGHAGMDMPGCEVAR